MAIKYRSTTIAVILLLLFGSSAYLSVKYPVQQITNGLSDTSSEPEEENKIDETPKLDGNNEDNPKDVVPPTDQNKEDKKKPNEDESKSKEGAEEATLGDTTKPKPEENIPKLAPETPKKEEAPTVPKKEEKDSEVEIPPKKEESSPKPENEKPKKPSREDVPDIQLDENPQVPDISEEEVGNKPKTILENKKWSNVEYPSGTIGKQWEKFMLDGLNLDWWIERVENLKDYGFDYLESYEFKALYKYIESGRFDGKLLMRNTCLGIYRSPYRREHRNDPIYRDAWVFCKAKEKS